MSIRLQKLLGISAGIMLVFTLLSTAVAQKKRFDFASRHKAIKEKFEKTKGKIRNQAVHNPPMIKADESDLGDSEPVIGIYLNKEARAYPLGMLFGGGGIFELLNDTCGNEPIAASW